MSEARGPAGTTVRFALLVALALATAASIYAVVMPPGLRRTVQAIDECHVRSGFYLEDGPLNVWQGAARQAGLTRFSQCLAELVPLRLWAMLGGMLGLVVVAALLYYVQPQLRISRRRLAGLDPVDAADLLAELHALAAGAGLRYRPVFLVDPINPRAGGLAFGRGRMPYVCLDAGLITLRGTDPASFRAVVLHELAHLRNRDVSITYLTVAVWRAFLLVALLPWLVALAFPQSWSSRHTGLLVESAGRIAVLVLIVYLSRNAVLRSRERHADAQVSRWMGSTDPAVCLPALSAGRGRGWGSWWRSHPSAGDRAGVLADPLALPRPGFWESFAAGLAFQLGWIQLAMPALTWGSAPDPVLWVLQRLWGLGLAVLLLITALRMTAFLNAGGRSRRVLVLPSLGLVAGAVLGESLPVMSDASLLPGLAAVLAGAVLAVQVVLLGWWVVWVAGLIRAGAGGRARRLAWLGLGATVLGLCVAWFRWWSSFSRLETVVEVVRQTQAALLRVAEVTWTGVDHLLIRVVLHPVALGFAAPDAVVTVCLVLIWLVPLLLGAARGTLRFALLAGLVGGAVWLAFELVLRAALRGAVSAPQRASEGMIAVLTAWEIGAVVLAQLVVSAVVVARRANLAAGLFAAATTGLIGTLGVWVLHATDACVPLFQATMTTCPVPLDPGYGATVLGLVTAEGTLAALAGAVPGYLLRVRAAPRAGPVVRPGRVAVAAVAALSVFLLVWPRPAGTDDGPVQRATAAERTAGRPDIVEALRTWLRGGGSGHLDTITARLGEIVQAVNNDDAGAMREAAVRLGRAIDDASAFPGPPGDKASQAWRAGLVSIGTAARMLTVAIDRAAVPAMERGVALLSSGLDELAKLRLMVA